MQNADALHQAGKIELAKKKFIEAENIQQKWQPEYPYLYSVRGFKFCDLLLSMGKFLEVLKKAKTTLKRAEEMKILLDIGLNKLETH